ncbi:MAG TPA: MFS transporter, partial [Chloroflexia bacterium]|nr:MFS transporter [Chloroflexia bacterium]
MDERYRANIPKYFLYSVLRGAASGTPVVLWVVFLQRHYGYDLTAVTLLDLPFWLGKFLFEIPTGVVADRFGRRPSLALGALLGSGIWIVFATAGDFWVMAGAQFLGGLAATFSSGAAEAILFETMQKLGRGDEYAKIAGRAGAIQTASALGAGLVVGLIAAVDLVLPVIITAALIALTLVPIATFRETGGSRPGGDPAPRYSTIVRQAVGTLRASGHLRGAMTYLVVLSSIGFYAEVFLQPYALAVGLPLAALGAVTAAVQGLSIAGGLAVPGAQRLLGRRGVLYGAPVGLVLCLLLLGLAGGWTGLAAAALAAFLFAVAQPIMLGVVQGQVG